jgi:hypothetical protein
MNVSIDLSQEVLDQIGIDNIQTRIKHLYLLFGTRFNYFVPEVINDSRTLMGLMSMSSSLETLEHCPGFDEHLKEYFNNSTSTAFVSYIANSLIGKVQYLELEPFSNQNGRKPDLKVIASDLEFFIECKYPFLKTQFDFSAQHRTINDRIRNEIYTPHQIGIQYYSKLNDADIDQIIQILKSRLPFCTSDGVLYSSRKYEMNIVYHSDYKEVPYTFQIVMPGTSIETQTNNYLPNHTFFTNGTTLSIAGPLIDYRDVLTKLIKKSTGQAINKKPFLLAISINNMLGSLNENIKVIQNSFHPQKNTRFTGVLLVEHRGSNELSKKQFVYIQNPYSNAPDSNIIRYLFK